ncbi:LytTR family DNA-binding domain-containing protein [Winogradskyella sp.]|uniref:LytR/AlgR family response regulator transcription factor n=1 Tax=Winogradskyella sp. TaxID=1883156 RepID=UPI0026152946|nr:LytTR family DNA-binding domain-containing protein [Winogradskyella sp.]
MKWLSKLYSLLNTESIVFFSYYRPIRSTCLLSAVLFFFLWLIKPFTLAAYSDIWAVIFSLIFATIPLVIYVLAIKVFVPLISVSIKEWKLKTELVFVTFMLFISSLITIGYAHFVCKVFYNAQLIEDYIKLCFYANFIIGYGLFILLKMVDFLTYYRQVIEIKEVSSSLHRENRIVISGERANEELIIPDTNVLYFESRGKFAIVNYMVNNELREKEIKVSLKKIESQLNIYHEFLRCHNSFIVNANKVTEIVGNSRTAVLILDSDIKIPISRSKLNVLKQQIFDSYKISID